jgi:CheY-like chemotaxis protein
MEKIITWMRTVEMLASNVYMEASDLLADDQRFSAFLSRMSEEEAWHYHIMGSASQYLTETKKMPQPVIEIDADTKEMVETSFQYLHEAIINKTATKKDVVECIVKTEFAEWNHIFVYVINTLQETTSMFQHVAATIESHIKKVQEFLEDLPEDLKVPDVLWKLPDIWDKKILIVENEASIKELLANALKGMGNVETAASGREALDKTKKEFFNVVVSGIDIPEMNGIEFFEKAVAANPNISRQFVFYTDDITSDLSTFFGKNHLPFLKKPFSLRRFNRIVQEMIEKTL